MAKVELSIDSATVAQKEISQSLGIYSVDVDQAVAEYRLTNWVKLFNPFLHHGKYKSRLRLDYSAPQYCASVLAAAIYERSESEYERALKMQPYSTTHFDKLHQALIHLISLKYDWLSPEQNNREKLLQTLAERLTIPRLLTGELQTIRFNHEGDLVAGWTEDIANLYNLLAPSIPRTVTRFNHR